MTTMNNKTVYAHENIGFERIVTTVFKKKTRNQKRSARYGYSTQEKRIQKYGLVNYLAYDDDQMIA